MKLLWAMSIFQVAIILLLIASRCSCKECSVTEHEINPLLQRLIRIATNLDQEPDPATFLALRLASRHNLQIEKQLLDQLKKTIVDKVTKGEDVPFYLTVRYALAFRSACLNPASISHNTKNVDLVKMVKDKLDLEIRNIEAKGQPLTDFYQISSAILVLCFEEKNAPTYIVQDIIYRALRRQAPFITPVDINAASMTVLAFTCLHRIPFKSIASLWIERAIVRLLLIILSYQGKNNLFATVCATPLAVQALHVTHQMPFRPFKCTNNLQRLLIEVPKGTFNTPKKLFHVIPTFEGISMLQIGNQTCDSSQGILVLD